VNDGASRRHSTLTSIISSASYVILILFFVDLPFAGVPKKRSGEEIERDEIG
jgi:hypothetical protein